jgi:DNA-binding MarR family transcriptional regulator
MSSNVKRTIRKPFSAGLGYFVRETHKAMMRRLAEELTAQGIAPKHYYYLRALYEENGITQIELGERVGMNRATVTRVVDTMVRSGLVRRIRNPDDRRKINIVLTPRAERLRQPLLHTVETLNAEAMRGLSATEARVLRAALRHVLENLGVDPYAPIMHARTA